MFETLPGQTLCEARPEFTRRRSAWPLRPAVCALLLGPRLATVASALLGCQACWLFNDQARLDPYAWLLSAQTVRLAVCTGLHGALLQARTLGAPDSSTKSL